MTMNKIWDKLRKYNRGAYRQFKFCIGFAVLLISSYLMMLFSPLVQNTLPIGGDTRKQVYMIFWIAVAGCTIFVLYATGLFYRYKSRELGVFLALGTDKGKLIRATLVETAKIVVGCTAAGIAGGCVVSLIIGKIFEAIASRANDNKFGFSIMGISYTLAYGIAVFILVLISMMRYLKRSNVLDIMNQQRKQEPLNKTVTAKYLVSGIVLLVIGIVLSFFVPNISLRVFHHVMGIWTNLFYLLVLLGLYRIMVYSIASHRRGKNPQKYYNHVISYGMLKFQGSTIVRNMLVITLLVMGGLFASYYVPMALGRSAEDVYEDGYEYRYTGNADEITEEEVKALADEYGVAIENYREGEFIQVDGDGVIREDFDAKGNLIVEYAGRYAAYECINTSQYQRMTGQNIEVQDGTYYMIVGSDTRESLYYQFGDMEKLYPYDSTDAYPLEYAGNAVYNSLKLGWAFDEDMRCVISDQDYEVLRQNLPEERLITQVLFDSENSDQAIEFANALYREYALRVPDNMKVPGAYSIVRHELDGEDYGYNYPAVYDPENAARESDWRYVPNFVYLNAANQFLSYAVFFMMLMYVAVICLASAGIISYTRSQSIGISSQQVFEDVGKLGANNDYVRKLLKVQVKKVFVLPTIVGCIGMYCFEMLLLYQNDNSYSAVEIRALGICLIFTLAVVLYQYVMYRISLKKAVNMLGLAQ